MDSFQTIIYHSPFDDKLKFKSLLEPRNIPLWDRRNLQLRNDEEYFNFEIIEKDSDTDSEDIKDEITDTIQYNQCHLCNIQIPNGYMKSHQNSEKHRTYVKISEIALDRVRKQMTVIYPTEKDNNSMYFCDSCVIIIPKRDKQTHLLSNHHKNSNFIDKLLNDFSKLYSDDIEDSTSPLSEDNIENIEQDNNDEINESGLQQINQNEPMKIAIDGTLKNIITKLKTYINIHYLDEKYLIIETEDINIKVTHKNFHSFFILGGKHAQCKLCCEITKDMNEHILNDKHLKKLALPIDKNCIRKLEDSKGHCILCNELIECPEVHALCDRNHDNYMNQATLFDKNIEIEPNVTNKVENKNNEEIEPIITTDKSKYYFCNVCYIPVYDDDKDTHCYDPKHIYNTRIKEHYLFDFSHTLKKLNCLICNTLVHTNKIKDHLLNTKHITEYNDFLAFNYLNICKKNIFCELCMIYINIGDEIKHTKSLIHMEIIKSKNEGKTNKSKNKKNKKDKKKDQMKTIDIDTKTSVDKTLNDKETSVTCKVCDITMQNKEVVIKTHLLNYHQIDDAKSVIENSKMKLVGNLFICENCCEYVAIENHLKHLSSLTHIVKSFKKPQINLNPEKTFALALKNDDKNNNEVPSTSKNNEIPSTSKKNEVTSTSKNNEVPSTSKNNEVPSTSKNNEVPSTSKNNEVPLTSKNEPATVKTNTGLPVTLKNTVLPSPVQNKLPAKDIFLMPKREKIDIKPIFCFICNTNVPGGVNAIKIHGDGKKHNQNLQIVMKNNNIEDRVDHYRCTICCMQIDKTDLVNHINSKYHLSVEKNKPGVTTITYCDVCQKYITMKMEAHVLSSTHKSKEIPKTVPSYICHICDVELSNSLINKKEHNDGNQHKNNVKILDDNTIKVLEDKCYCETCDMSFVFKLIRQHISTSQHLILMGNDVPQ